MATNPWGGPGRWALEAEAAEAEDDASAPPPPPSAPPELFPSLKEVAATAGKSKKKNKGTTVPLSQFTIGNYTAPQPQPATRGLTPSELLILPTGPRERTDEELERARFGGGGGFRSYPSRDDRPPPRSADLDLPSRADEVDNWGAAKKTMPLGRDADRRGGERFSSLGSGSGISRADENRDWSSGKKPMSHDPATYRSLGSGLEPRALESERWVRGQSLDSGDNGERRKLVLEPPRRDGSVVPPPAVVESARSRPNPFGAARPREEVLAEKGVDWKKVDLEVDLKKGSKPNSEHSSRPSSAQSSRPGSPGSTACGDLAVKPRPKANPFGDAKPREVVLQAKGKDWRKIDFEIEHRGIDRQETLQEKELKQEIDGLKEQLKEIKAKIDEGSKEVSDDDAKCLQEEIYQKEKELELLICDLDDKVRFGERRFSEVRPSSGPGRLPSFSQTGMGEVLRVVDNLDRPHSRGSQTMERPHSRGSQTMDRPHSRGSQTERPHSRGSQHGDSWSKPTQVWGFHGNRDSLGRNTDGPMARQRW